MGASDRKAEVSTSIYLIYISYAFLARDLQQHKMLPIMSENVCKTKTIKFDLFLKTERLEYYLEKEIVAFG